MSTDREEPPRKSALPRPSEAPRTSESSRTPEAPRLSQPPRLSRSAAPDARELIDSARIDIPTVRNREEIMSRVLSAHRKRRAAQRVVVPALGFVCALAAGIALWQHFEPPPELLLSREHPIASQGANRPASPSASTPAKTAASASANPSAPASGLELCAPAVSAAGSAPLIDDFEDGDGRISPFERRAGFWSATNDNTGKQQPALRSPFPMSRIPGGRGASQYALHVSGGKFSKWGALLSAELSARRCYDASVYAGLTFWTRGRGSINVVAKMTQIAPEEYGGSCTHDCYDAHLATLTLSNKWQEQRVTWAELKQKGYGQVVPFDPRSLLSLEFTVGPEQTPFDFWVDDIRFLER